MTDELLPPILQTPGLTIVCAGHTSTGRAFFKLATTGRSAHPVREVVVVVELSGEFEFEYSIYDRSIAQIVTYRGPFGDPERDNWISNRSLLPPQE